MERAIDYYDQHLAVAREIDDRRGELNALGNLGLAYADLGQVERAIGYHEQSLVIAREIGDRQGEWNSLGNLGLAYSRLGQVERAIDFYEQQLAIVREIGDRRGEGAALRQPGHRLRAQPGPGGASHRIPRAGAGHLPRDRRPASAGNSLGNLGTAYAHLGQVERAIGILEQALRIGQEIKDPRIIQFTSDLLERLRGNGSAENPENG